MKVQGENHLYDVFLDWLTDPRSAGLIRRALAANVVLDTWQNGESEESFTSEAEGIIERAAEEWTLRALGQGALFPAGAMPEGYIHSMFEELLSSTALYLAQRRRGRRDVDGGIAAEAAEILRRFVESEEGGLSAAGGYYFLISAHEDLNAIRYYRRMALQDFLLGTLHRPWSDMLLTSQLQVYQAAGLVQTTFTGAGEMLELTRQGETVLAHLRSLLQEAGEFEWRSSAQRWVIFSETDYDTVFRRVIPDADRVSREFLDGLEIPPGAQVLEIGAGTGRVTVDLGLATRVGEAGGHLIALEPSGALIQVLRKKCLQRGIPHVTVVQGAAEALPFPDHSFDLVVSVAVLHFTELRQAVREMVRVTKPGGLVAAAFATRSSFLDIPMVRLWFRPVSLLASDLGVPLGERVGLPPGLVAEEFRAAGLGEVQTTHMPLRVAAHDHRSFLEFIVKGAAFYQNILSRLPFHERWQILRRLEEIGAGMVEATLPEEREMTLPEERVFGRVPAPVGHVPDGSERLPVSVPAKGPEAG